MAQIEEWQVPLWDEINRMIEARMLKPSELRIQSVNRIHEIIRDALRDANERIAELERELRDAKSPNSTPTPLSPRKDLNG